MSIEKLVEEIEKRKAILFSSECCFQCMREVYVAGHIFIPLEAGLSIQGKEYFSIAAWVCRECVQAVDVNIVSSNIRRMLMEFNVKMEIIDGSK